ncbi:MAG: 3'-5' exoribonuclease YhaM family protein [Thermoleophilaceae bacterium]
MEQPTLTASKIFVRDLQDGQDVDTVFLVRERKLAETRNGDPFLRLELGDVTGSLQAVAWDGATEAAAACEPGAVVHASGRFSIHDRYGRQLKLRGVRTAAAGEYELADLLEGPPVTYDKMAADLEDLIDTVQRPYLRELLGRLISPTTEIGHRWHQAPAAKYYHQAYRHGLLEHCLSVAQGVSAMAATFPGIDRDVAVTGALLHDIGKVEAYAAVNGAIELTDAGKLLAEIPLGYYTVRREIESIEGFPAECAQAVLHIILSHHGKLEHGSPVVPCTREATLVHMIDNLGGTLGSYDRLQKALADGERWSGFDRGISAAAYFAPGEAA